MGDAGSRNLKAWRATQDADAREVRERVAKFKQQLTDDLAGDDSAIAVSLAASVAASYGTVLTVNIKLTKGYGRFDKVKELHALLVEAQRLLFRNLKMLLELKATPEYAHRALDRYRATIPAQTEEQRQAAAEATAARIKLECEAAKKKFAWIETGDRPDEC